MFKYAIFLCMFGFYNVELQAMRGAAAAPAAPPAVAAVSTDDSAITQIIEDLNEFILADPHAALKRIHQAIIFCLKTQPTQFGAFMEKLTVFCAERTIDLKAVCSLSITGEDLIVDVAITAGCSIHVIYKLIVECGAPVNYIDSKTPTLKTAWNACKNPSQKQIIELLLKSDPYKPTGIIVKRGELGLRADDMMVSYITGLNTRSANPAMCKFALLIAMEIAGKNTPGFVGVCECGSKDCKPVSLTPGLMVQR